MVKKNFTTILMTVNIRLAICKYSKKVLVTFSLIPKRTNQIAIGILIIIYKLKIHLINTHAGFDLYLHTHTCTIQSY